MGVNGQRWKQPADVICDTLERQYETVMSEQGPMSTRSAQLIQTPLSRREGGKGDDIARRGARYSLTRPAAAGTR
jgi:hypothetical protein